MTTIERLGPSLAPLVGAGLTVTASGLVPLSIALTAGVVLTIAIRQVFDTRAGSTISVGVVVFLVGLELFARSIWTAVGGDQTVVANLSAANSARLLVGLAVGGLLVHELLVRTEEILDAGSTEAAGRHRYWTAPTTFVALSAVSVRDTGLVGLGRPLAAGAVVTTVVVHTLLVTAGTPKLVTVPTLSLAVVSLFALGMVADGSGSVDGTGHSSVIDGFRRFVS